MDEKIIEKIKQLVYNTLPEKESEKLIEEIKKDKELKLYFTLFSRIKQKEKEKLKQRLKQNKNIMLIPPAATTLNEIDKAAFSGFDNKSTTDLPVDDDVIDEFLEGNE